MRIILVLIIFIALPSSAFAWLREDRTLFDDPIYFQLDDVDIGNAIQEGMDRHGWRVQNRVDGSITAYLYEQGNEISVKIDYTPTQVNFVPLLNRRYGCEGSEPACAIEDELYNRWRLNLRRGISRALHEAAINTAYLSFPTPFSSDNSYLGKEKQRYAVVFFGGDAGEIKSMAAELEWKGLSDPALFDIIEKRLVESAAKNDSQLNNLVAWQSRALAFSGNEKYLNTLQQIVDTTTIEKIATVVSESIVLLHQYKRWNPVITSGLDAVSEDKIDETRIRNALASGQPGLAALAAPIFYRQYRDNAELLDLAQQALLKDYQLEGDVSLKITDYAYFCRALGESGSPQYLDTLKAVATNAVNEKVRAYAGRYVADPN